MGLVVAGMVAVVLSFVALAATDAQSVRRSYPGLRLFVRLAWLLVILLGWGVLAYLAWGTPGGLDAAWTWVQDQSLVARIAMWLLLLPWMGALWVSQTSLAEWIKTTLVLGIAVLTVAAALHDMARRT
jgi:hypothetical protein